MIHARVIGTGSFLPGEPVINSDLVARGIETSDELAVKHCGRRRCAQPKAIDRLQGNAPIGSRVPERNTKFLFGLRRQRIAASGLTCFRTA